MRKKTGALSDQEVLQRLGMNEQALEKEALMILEASDEEFTTMIAPYKDSIERIAQRMMSPDEIIKAGAARCVSQPGK